MKKKLFVLLLGLSLLSNSIFSNSYASEYESSGSYTEAVSMHGSGEFYKVIDEEKSDENLTFYKYVDEFGNDYSYDFDESVDSVKNSSFRTGGSLPSKFSLVDENAVTSIKDQGSSGMCWAYATIAAAETNLIKKNIFPIDIDLSEKHLVWFSKGSVSKDKRDIYYNRGYNGGKNIYEYGGNIETCIDALARWVGPVENKYAYFDESVYERDDQYSPVDEALRYNSIAHLQQSNEYVLNELNNYESVKRAIMEKGALYVSFVWNKLCANKYEDVEYKTYCYDRNVAEGVKNTSHAVVLVGWDDNFSKDNFNAEYPPEHDGAWLIKNSWGINELTDSYMWISYCDETLSNVTGVEMEPFDNYGYIYQYDITADTYKFNYGCGIEGANVFKADKDDVIEAVGFYTKERNTEVAVKVYADNVEIKPYSMDGKTVYDITGGEDFCFGSNSDKNATREVIENPGFHTVKLNSPVSVKRGDYFTVVVSVINNRGSLACERNYGVKYGDCFTRNRLLNEAWEEASGYTCCIKAYTRYSEGGCNHLHWKYNVINKAEPTYYCKGYTGDVFCPECNKIIEYGESVKKVPFPKVDTVFKDKSTNGKYKITNASKLKVTYVAPVSLKKSTLTVPDKVKYEGLTYTVTAVSKNAFKNNKTVKKIVLGKNIKSIGKDAFYNTKALTVLKINSTVLNKKYISTNSFRKIGSKAKVYVPKKQYKSYISWLKKRFPKNTKILKK